MFEEIYAIAQQAGSFDEFRARLGNRYVDAGSNAFPFYTAAGQFASENEHEKVEWLREVGARVNTIARGYAITGNHERVEAYRTEHGASIDVIARGYAIAGNHERVEAYLRDHGASVDNIAAGYAAAGNHERVEAYLRDHDASFDIIATGYALAGNHERVEHYRRHGASVGDIACGYLLVGNHERVEHYRTEHGASVDKIACHYAMVGNHERVAAYRTEHGASVAKIVRAYALVGNYENESEINLKSMLDRYINQREQVTEQGKIKEYLHGNFFPSFQKSYVQKKDAVNALKDALEGKNVDLISHLATLRNGNLGSELRRLVNNGCCNHFIDKKVNTVSEFVNALQAKIEKSNNYGVSAKKAR